MRAGTITRHYRSLEDEMSGTTTTTRPTATGPTTPPTMIAVTPPARLLPPSTVTVTDPNTGYTLRTLIFHVTSAVGNAGTASPPNPIDPKPIPPVVQAALQEQPIVQQVLASSNTAVNTPPPPPGPTVNNFQVDDMTTATSFNRPGMPYTGPVAGVQNQYVQLNADNLDIKALTPNAFIHSDGGNDTLTAF